MVARARLPHRLGVVVGAAVLVVAVSAAGTLAGCGSIATPTTTAADPSDAAPTRVGEPAGTPSSTTSSVPAETTPDGAVAAVAALTVKGRGPSTGYDRDLFGWNSLDFDRNGCDQRNDVLRRDLAPVVIRPGSNGCRVESGVLHDRYSQTAIALPRAEIQIDHVVALSNAWQHGAARWPAEQRQRFANDPLNLIATTATLNQRKGAGDAATWLPPAVGFRCAYVARQAAVKLRYGLSVTAAEQQAMNRILTDCPGESLPTGDETAPAMTVTVPPSATSPSPEPHVSRAAEPPSAPATDPRFGSCREVADAGLGPYVRGRDPEYVWYRDGDGNGVVCE